MGGNDLNASCMPSETQRINDYLGSFNDLKADFTQIAASGKQSTGMFIMKRPNLMKLEYKRPHVEMLYRNGQISFYDHEMESMQKRKIHNFILRAILDGKIQNRNLSCQSIHETDENIVVYSKAKYDVITSSDLTITFAKTYDNKLSLKAIENRQKNDQVKIIFNNLNYSTIPSDLFNIQK
jgi:outer membrane lipoprotein-sorting protein